MDTAEARQILIHHLTPLRARGYEDLLRMLGDVTVVEVRSPSGAEYQIELQVLWDNPSKKDNLRVLGAIDEGRLPGAMFPLCESFIVAPDGTFVGE